MALTPEERAVLALDLIHSLDAAAEPGAELAWVNELEGRARECADGSVELVDWDDVRERIRHRLQTQGG